MFYIISPVFTMGLLVFLNSITIRRLTYNKTEKLKSRKSIELLFSKGKSFSVHPIRVLYDVTEFGEVPLQAGVTVSSRHFRKAVHRNRVKRVMREVFRLQKLPLQNILLSQQRSLHVFFIYIGRELPVFAELSEKMQLALQRLHNLVSKPVDN